MTPSAATACLVATLASISSLAAPPPAQSPGLPATITYAGDADFPPYEFLDDAGRPAGLNIDLIRAVARVHGLAVTVDLRPWPDVRAGLLAGRFDVASMYRSDQRAREVDFAIPHELVFHEMFIRRGAPGVRSLADLTGRRIIVQRDTYAEDALGELGYQALLRSVPSEPDALRDLAAGAGDVAIVTQTPGRPFLARGALSPDVVASGPPVLLSEYAFVTRKGQRALIEALNDGVAAVKASGEYEQIYIRWIRPDRSEVVARRFGWALVLTLLLGGVGAAWTQTLRRRVARQTHALRREFLERERAQAALAASEQSLRQAHKMESIGRLAGGVAHDFNNILTVILNYASFLRDDLADRRLRTQDADEVIAATERAMRLTRQLLVFSRSTPMQVGPIDVCSRVREIRTMVQRLVGEDIAVEVHLPGEPLVVDADLVQIEQIFLNLVANARDAMPDGGRLTITVELRALASTNPVGLPGGDYVAIVVVDTGHGMDEATQARIFDPFFTTKAPGRGTGLGLATVFSNIAKIGGRIAVDSAPGAGTTFTVWLPRSQAAPGDSRADGASPTATAIDGAPLVLLAEDDEALRRAGRQALESAGCRVIDAADGVDAIATAARHDAIAVLVTDVVMPGRSGPQVAAALRQHRPSLRVLYVSGYVHENQHIDLEPPGTAFLSKPYTPHALVDGVARLLAGA